MVLYRILWSIDIILGIIAVAFFVIGIGDGSVSSFNAVLWTLLLGGLAAVIFGSRALHNNGHRALATTLAALPAIPSVIFGAGMAAAIFGGVRWN